MVLMLTCVLAIDTWSDNLITRGIADSLIKQSPVRSTSWIVYKIRIIYNSPRTSGTVHYLKKYAQKIENNNGIKRLIWIHFRSITDNTFCSLSHLKQPSHKMMPFNGPLWPHQHRGAESFTAVFNSLWMEKLHNEKKITTFFQYTGSAEDFLNIK